MIRATLALALGLCATPAMAQDAAKAAYTTDCSACHQENGQGVSGSFPALAGDAFVKGDPAAVIGVVLNGRAAMPPFKADLDDAEIAAAVSYIRSAWGNAAAPVTPAAVAKVRAAAPR
ncbi:MAG TPA: cytochrome c [Caulobacteraceae bacterium]|jgi:mono/diheme cytochrome c family protein|nr:cytochrome c [Caulobacteraceae bacterium]